MMFFIGVFINGEDMESTKLIGFAFIWAALAFLSLELTYSSNVRSSSN